MIPKPEAPVLVASAAKGKSKGTPASGRKHSKSAAAESEKDRVQATAARSYQVRGGDTLYAIAVRNGTTVERLRDVNRLSAKSSIKPGDKLRLPS